MVGFVMRFTESALMSLVVRKPNSTPVMAEDVGWWVFMAAAAVLVRLLFEQVARNGLQYRQQRRDAGGEEKVRPGFSPACMPRRLGGGSVDFASPPQTTFIATTSRTLLFVAIYCQHTT